MVKLKEINQPVGCLSVFWMSQPSWVPGQRRDGDSGGTGTAEGRGQQRDGDNGGTGTAEEQPCPALAAQAPRCELHWGKFGLDVRKGGRPGRPGTPRYTAL
uniref:Uncharacterized protein n=1 Tax=Columba livia TaxID=8932 RepID=R7VQH3_COLLI